MGLGLVDLSLVGLGLGLVLSGLGDVGLGLDSDLQEQRRKAPFSSLLIFFAW